ncbi:DUF4291 domain-containing protein [Dinghuibacter silviterrae]|uniref:Uncharacterized protein DUF4291 n=1 Tax=Dinghuibacter silviterrae TaxID=1539049 RepID=A0A4R8DFX6_9BACT|nr:DUF4291 domain-containing protein [Dinghuibacter silviterrae]TDW96144.1 uncharacterized protein DUF4291 [Dinghuibacter silviterrae]
MNLSIEKYTLLRDRWPPAGQQVIAQHTAEEVVVYQAYKHSIADFAVRHQYFGGSEYSYQRMSWIKPNFLWMMYRCGWAEKPNQERVLALWISKGVLRDILSQAVITAFDPDFYSDSTTWKQDLESKDVRLQWDPDHDPYGVKQSRRAIQLGLKASALGRFAKEQIHRIEDITDFVRVQKQHVDARRLDLLEVPVETVWSIGDADLEKRIGIANR